MCLNSLMNSNTKAGVYKKRGCIKEDQIIFSMAFYYLTSQLEK